MKSTLRVLQMIADKHYDGHLTIMKFTTNWRIGFTTPNTRDEISAFSHGKTLDEAAFRAIERHMNEESRPRALYQK
jgi:hypothetical protein